MPRKPTTPDATVKPAPAKPRRRPATRKPAAEAGKPAADAKGGGGGLGLRVAVGSAAIGSAAIAAALIYWNRAKPD